ncbi:hypothetical protein H6F95_29615 [Cyanobacteria bacterium FACHB-471]|nr:hypothetical protein [Cyanobacteria bacterium FACHB-471]
MTAKETIDDLKECAIALMVCLNDGNDGMFVAIALMVCAGTQKNSPLKIKVCWVTAKVHQQTGKVEPDTTKV